MADIFQSTAVILADAMTSVSQSFIGAVPSIFAAIILIIIGYLLGWIAKKIVSKALKSAGLDAWMEEQNLSDAIGNRKVSNIAGSIVKWYFLLIFLKQAVEITQLTTLDNVLGFWTTYLLVIIAGVIIVLAGLIAGRFVRNAIESSKNRFKRLVGLIVEVVIVYIALVMGIKLIGLPTELLEFTFLIGVLGFVLAISIAIGLSFGLAMKDEAKVLIREIKKKN